MMSSTKYESSPRQASSTDDKYDVFLSFRGYDTRSGFTSYLCFALCLHRVITFMDLILEKGEKLDQLFQKVVESRISIVVFSKNFASSEWCLNELVKIFQEKARRDQDVLPVFYKVDPSELRHQNKGKTKEHMDKHYNRYGKDSDMVNTWSNAIKELGELSGWTYSPDQGKTEVELILEIVKVVLIKLHGEKTVQERSLMLSPSNLSDIIAAVNANMNEEDKGKQRLVYESDSGCIKSGLAKTDGVGIAQQDLDTICESIWRALPSTARTGDSSFSYLGVTPETNLITQQGPATISESSCTSLLPATTEDSRSSDFSYLGHPPQTGNTSSSSLKKIKRRAVPPGAPRSRMN